jgi:hypothetical protein
VQNFTAYPQMPDVKALVEYGIRMEQLGFDSLWVWDHILLGVDPNFPIIESLTQQHQGRRHRTSYGRVAASGNFVVDGARIAVDDINAKGGGDGFREGHKFKRGRLANLPNGPDAKVESLARGSWAGKHGRALGAISACPAIHSPCYYPDKGTTDAQGHMRARTATSLERGSCAMGSLLPKRLIRTRCGRAPPAK